MWNKIIEDEKNKSYYKKMWKIIESDYKNGNVFPSINNIFKAFEVTKYNNVKVVILGQDPYHNKGQANGLSFSVDEGVKIPPSLRNMFKELKKDIGIERNNTNLIDWANQGVLMLNAFLTVKENEPLSHSKIGWDTFCNNIISKISDKDEKVIFLLMGNFAKSKKKYIDESKHCIIETVHPSPLSASRGFFDSKIYSKINNELIKKIIW